MITKKQGWILGGSITALIIAGGLGWWYYQSTVTENGQAQQFARQYADNFERRDYQKLFKQVDQASLKQNDVSTKSPAEKMTADFKYLGINKVKVSDVKTMHQGAHKYLLQYQADLMTPIGVIKNQHYRVPIEVKDKKATVIYSDSLIIPGLQKSQKLNIFKDGGERGEILDRNGKVLAGNQATKILKIVPRYFINDDGSIDQTKVADVANKYNVSGDEIDKGINEYHDHPDWGYTVKTLTDDDYQGDDENDGASVQTAYERTYPKGAAFGLLLGYTGTATADDVAKNSTLSGNDIVGRAGLEQTLDQRLRGKEAVKYQILNANGTTDRVLLEQKFEKGEDIKLTVDADLQQTTYDGFAGKPGAAVIQAPKTGELLAVVSSPSFAQDTMAQDYNSLANNQDYPFIERFNKGYAPASTFKQVSAAIGLENGTLNPDEVHHIDGKKWAPYSVTRVNSDVDVNLQTALQHSDNVYFAQEMLKVGREKFEKALQDKFTFGRDYKLPLNMASPSYSNSGKLENDKQLVDSAYGQGEMSVTPIEMVTMFNFLDNDGSIVMPKLLMDNKKPTVIKDVATSEHVQTILNDELGIVENADGYAHALYNDGFKLAAKTGTAETGNNNQNALVSVHDVQNNKFTGLYIVENSVLNGKDYNPQADVLAKPSVDYLEQNYK